MNATMLAVRLGVIRGWIETRQSLTERTDQIYMVFINACFILVLYLQRNTNVPGTEIPLAVATLPGLIALNVAVGGWMGTATQLSVEREDGTLLRAKSTPNGMLAYLVSRIFMMAMNVLVGLAVMLVAGLVLVDDLDQVGVGGWAMVLVLTVLGLTATLPWGAVVGSLVRSAGAGFGLTFLPISALVAISGIFYPITALSDWLAWVAQIFPVYWLGLGMRAAMMPDSAAMVEIGESWRHLETLGMLGFWTALGFAIAPRVLRRMARRESGSVVQERRARAMQQVG